MEQLTYALRGASYPAQRWQLLAWADHNAVGSQLRDAVWRLPVRTYANLCQVYDTVTARATQATPHSSGPTRTTLPVPRPTRTMTWLDRDRAGRGTAGARGVSTARGGA
jgi:hypothetical protein